MRKVKQLLQPTTSNKLEYPMIVSSTRVEMVMAMRLEMEMKMMEVMGRGTWCW